ncbi:MAG: hypothetical protein MZV63_57680 [Marinilabiliales bacterium]|nr:hypothetical protein [Marinilabiliales bacterium]
MLRAASTIKRDEEMTFSHRRCRHRTHPLAKGIITPVDLYSICSAKLRARKRSI